MHTASAKARQEMMDNIPVHEKVRRCIYQLCRGSPRNQRKRYRYPKEFSDRYGIDMKEIFEDYYKANAVKPENEANAPTKETTAEQDSDDLLS